MSLLPDSCGPSDFNFTLAMPDSQSASFAVDPAGLRPDPHYVWHKIENGVDTVVGGDSPTYTTERLISESSSALAYYPNTQFYVILNNRYRSRTATLLVEPPKILGVSNTYGLNPDGTTNYGHADLVVEAVAGPGAVRYGMCYLSDYKTPAVQTFAPDTPHTWSYNPVNNAQQGSHEGGYWRVISNRGVGFSPWLRLFAAIWDGVSTWSFLGGEAVPELPYVFSFVTLPAEDHYSEGPITLRYQATISRSTLDDPSRVIFDPGSPHALVRRVYYANDPYLTYDVTYPAFSDGTRITPRIYALALDRVGVAGSLSAPTLTFYGRGETHRTGWQIYPSGRNR